MRSGSRDPSDPSHGDVRGPHRVALAFALRRRGLAGILSPSSRRESVRWVRGAAERGVHRLGRRGPRGAVYTSDRARERRSLQPPARRCAHPSRWRQRARQRHRRAIDLRPRARVPRRLLETGARSVIVTVSGGSGGTSMACRRWRSSICVGRPAYTMAMESRFYSTMHGMLEDFAVATAAMTRDGPRSLRWTTALADEGACVVARIRVHDGALTVGESGPRGAPSWPYCGEDMVEIVEQHERGRTLTCVERVFEDALDLAQLVLVLDHCARPILAVDLLPPGAPEMAAPPDATHVVPWAVPRRCHPLFEPTSITPPPRPRASVALSYAWGEEPADLVWIETWTDFRQTGAFFAFYPDGQAMTFRSSGRWSPPRRLVVPRARRHARRGAPLRARRRARAPAGRDRAGGARPEGPQAGDAGGDAVTAGPRRPVEHP